MKHIWVLTGLFSLVVSGCTAELVIPEGYYLECDPEGADCPGVAECRESVDGVFICSNQNRPDCGNGIREGEELCDDGLKATNTYQFEKACNTACDGYTEHCGDGLIHGNEDCDDGNQQDNGNGCSATCTQCTSLDQCPQSGVVSCGDNQVNYLFEGCDEGEKNSDFCFHGEASCVQCVPPGYEDVNNSENNAPEGCQYREIAGTWCGDGVLQQAGIRGGVSTEAGGVDTGQWEACETGPWIRVDTPLSSLHPYANNSDIRYVIDAPAQATAVRLHFSSFDTEGGYDYVYVGEHRYSGTRDPFISDIVVGQSVTIRLTSDFGRQRYGFEIDYYEYSENYVTSCSSLDASLGSGTAYCRSDCSMYDISECSGQDMVLVPVSPFQMGCNTAVDYECGAGESPYHEVFLDSFLIDRREVTAGDYKVCVDTGACTYGGSTNDPKRTYDNGRDDHPINFVNLEDAQIYCAWLGKRLPTEAEWEKSARGTDGRKYPWGNSPEASCTHVVMNDGDSGCGEDQTWAVGSKPLGASPYGAEDMLGNVWEWTADLYSADYYDEMPAQGWINPEGPTNGMSQSLRGGSFFAYSNFYRASNRFDYPSGFRYLNLGFRCVQEVGVW